MLTLDMFTVVFTFLFIDIFDTMGTLIGVTSKMNNANDVNKPNLKKAFMADAIATVAGACFGTNTTTTYVESASAVAAGGRTGLASFTTAICFTIALIFAPLFLSIPSAAIAPALIIVGMMMITPIKTIDFNDYTEAIPSFVTIIMMPFAYSISDGIILGVLSFVAMNALSGKFHKITPSLWILSAIFIARYILV